MNLIMGGSSTFKNSILCLAAALFCSLISAEARGSQAPDWLKRTDFGLEIESDQETRFYLETIQPLHSSPDESKTWFTQGRASVHGGEATYSLGIGFRQLMNEELLLGINSFFDYAEEHKHYRTGVGFEAIGKRAEARVNTYIPLSPRRALSSTSTSTTFEEAVGGFDYEIGAPVPYVPWLKVFVGGFWYNYRIFDNKYGWQTRLEAKPSDHITIDLQLLDHNKDDLDYAAVVAVRLPFATFHPRDIFSEIRTSKAKYEDYDLKERRLDPVEREFDIETEKYVQTGNVTVEIGRQ